ncbi:MAG: hypothetical protein CL943_00725 [Candidatus Diapherotrites archaeon]|uniref:Xylose isomerase-like TIM barrel domain-containing protein n=1 Tax=Candidatus Iainarchaeum sp. TaxID=3101447 RepID=A0A2D6M060_9ARCH|nr:hypothetical protein [Candidatus Diapherotrites archaeon]|tara:strand:+ start:997 stop:1851 length:855 start_codon:yes stop_codon:yes gene_type:complete
MTNLVGLSTTYFAIQGKNIYDSVESVLDMGFNTVELGAAHSYEQDVWSTVKKIRGDFSGTNFTVHGLFPPQEEKFWFNPSIGLTSLNKKTIEALFKAAEITEAKVVGIHPGFLNKVGFGGARSGFAMPTIGEEISREKAVKGLEEVVSFALPKAREIGCDFAIESIPNEPLKATLFHAQDFQKLFEKFSGLGLLLDVGHAMVSGNIEELLLLVDKVREMHIHHFPGITPGNSLNDHKAFTSIEQLSFLEKVPQVKNIPLIFEHGNDVSKKEIVFEKKLVEQILE